MSIMIKEIESQKTNALNLSQQKICVKNGISECEQLLNRLKNDIEIIEGIEIKSSFYQKKNFWNKRK